MDEARWRVLLGRLVRLKSLTLHAYYHFLQHTVSNPFPENVTDDAIFFPNLSAHPFQASYGEVS